MAFIQEERREIHAKVVYAGPAGARECTRFIRSRLDPSTLGGVVNEQRGADELEGFEFRPVARLGADGLSTHLHLFSADNGAPGPEARRVLMRGVDAVVFIADGRREQLATNVERFAALREAAVAFGYELARVPLVIGIDHHGAGAIDEGTLRTALELGNGGVVLPLSVRSGEGVIETIKEATRQILYWLARPSQPAPSIKPSLIYQAHGRAADGFEYVTDGGLVLRRDLVEASPSPDGVRELSAEQLAPSLSASATAYFGLRDLVPSRVTQAVFRTPDDVPLAETYVRLLGALGRPIVLGTSGPRGVVVVRSGADVLGAVMPVALPPELGSPTPAQRWPSAVVLTALQRNGLLGEFDGGTWSRLMASMLDPSTVPDVATLMKRLEALELTLPDIVEALGTVYLERGETFSRGRRAQLDGIFLARRLDPEAAGQIHIAVAELAAASGVSGVVVEDPLDLRSIHRALALAFARAGQPGRVFLVGGQLMVIRESIVPLGPFANAVAG